MRLRTDARAAACPCSRACARRALDRGDPDGARAPERRIDG